MSAPRHQSSGRRIISPDRSGRDVLAAGSELLRPSRAGIPSRGVESGALVALANVSSGSRRLGWWLALEHLIVGALFCLTIIGIPLGVGTFKMAGRPSSPSAGRLSNSTSSRSRQRTPSQSATSRSRGAT
jgi:uncharacterized membrane protein YccF (DUF307 family)